MSEDQVADVVAEPVATEAPSEGFDWRTHIPEELKGNTAFDNHKDLGSLLKSHANVQSLIGADKLPIPSKNATEEQWNDVWSRLGRPTEPDGYDFKVEMPEGQQANNDLVGWFKGAAHKAGLNPTQGQQLLDGYLQLSNESGQQATGNIEALAREGQETLQREYGNAYSDKVEAGNAVLSEFGTENLATIQLADGRNLGDHPDFVKTIVNVSDFIRGKIGEDTIEGIKSSGAMTPNEAQEKLNQVKRINGPFWNKSDPEHNWAVQEALRLQHMITPS